MASTTRTLQRPNNDELPEEAALYFRDQFREARSVALKDAEAFEETIFVLERLGGYLNGGGNGLWDYKDSIREKAVKSPLAEDVPKRWRMLHTPFVKLYELVREARNAALHEGAFARHLTTHVVEVSIVMEDALADGFTTVSDYMVREPVCAAPWHPLSFVRQTMLANSYSYLPVRTACKGRDGWWIIADYVLARYLRSAESKRKRKHRLMMSLQESVETGELELVEPTICPPDTHVDQVLENAISVPVLVLDGKTDRLLGILTAFDLL